MVGYDGGKRVKGRKRHLLVDTEGWVWAVAMTHAGVQDRDGGRVLLADVAARPEAFERLTLLWVDAAYNGSFADAAAELGLRLATAPTLAGSGFGVLPRRWVVERTFAWLSRWRRLSKCYDLRPDHEAAWILVAMIGLGLRRLVSR